MSISNSALKTIRILEVIAKSDHGLTLSEISQALQLPKATVSDILQALYQEDAIYYKNRNLKTYCIGSRMFFIGESYIKNSNFISLAKPYLLEFSKKYSLLCYALKQIEDELVYVYKAADSNSILVSKPDGLKEKLKDNIFGRTFIAYLKNKEEFLSTEEDYSIDQDIITCGYGLDNGKTNEHIVSYAVPVFNFENRITGVLAASRLMNSKASVLTEIEELKRIAEEVSRLQGYKEEVL